MRGVETVCTDAPGLQWRGGSSGGARDIQGKTELYGFWVRAGGTATLVPVWSLPPDSPFFI